MVRTPGGCDTSLLPKTQGKEVIKLDNRIEKQIDVLVGALTDPIIVFDPSWANHTISFVRSAS